jgi:ABC-type sulfate/molybdate transport systems ATPase subunit
LARAVVARPAVLLLDEPFASLDPGLREEVRQAVLAAHAEYGPALVMVTHDLAEAGRVAGRLGVLLDGGIAQLDTPEGIFRRPASEAVARFLGLPNRVRCRTAGTGLVFPGGVDVSRRAEGALGSAARGPVVAIFGVDAARLRRPGLTGVTAVVDELHHRPEGVSARVRLTGGAGHGAGADAPSVVLEASIADDLGLPEAGDAVDVELVGDRMHVFPSEQAGQSSTGQ